MSETTAAPAVPVEETKPVETPAVEATPAPEPAAEAPAAPSAKKPVPVKSKWEGEDEEDSAPAVRILCYTRFICNV